MQNDPTLTEGDVTILAELFMHLPFNSVISITGIYPKDTLAKKKPYA